MILFFILKIINFAIKKLKTCRFKWQFYQNYKHFLFPYSKRYPKLSFKYIFVYSGEFIYSSFSVIGPFSKKITIAIYFDIFKNIDITYIIPNHKNENIENNNTYYLFIPTTIASSCDNGEYYDSSKYICYLKSNNNFKKIYMHSMSLWSIHNLSKSKLWKMCWRRYMHKWNFIQPSW